MYTHTHTQGLRRVFEPHQPQTPKPVEMCTIEGVGRRRVSGIQCAKVALRAVYVQGSRVQDFKPWASDCGRRELETL